MYGSTTQNFADLMSMAKQNAADARRRAQHSNLLPEVGRPKRADPKQVKLKEGVAKFLAKREEEDKKKKEEEKLKKERLLQLRNQDRKATNRVRKMLSMTKSANKSCVADAKDSLNASVAAQGEIQPDEDDYGYTSGYADMMHKKMMEKYKSIPIKPVFSESKAPVPKHQSLQKNGTGWRNKNNEDDYYENSPEQESYDEPVPSRKPEKTNKVPPKPPPPDYRQLLQLAQQKQLEPVLPSKPIIEKKGEREEFEYGRPMTAKEKAAFLAEKELRERTQKKFENYSADKNNNSSSDGRVSSKPSASFKIPKAKTKDDGPSPAAATPPKKARISEPELEHPKPSRENSKPDSKQNFTNNQNLPRANPMQTKPNGLKPTTSLNTQSPRPIEKPIKNHSSCSSPPSVSSKKDLHRPSESSKPERDRIVEKKIIDKMELIKQKPKYLSAFEGGKDKERDQLRKPQLEKSRPGTSRESTQGKNGDARFGEAREKPRKIMNDADKRPLKRDSPPHKREQSQPARRDIPPPTRREIPPPSRREMPPPSRREMPMKAPRMRDEPPRMKPKPNRGRAIIDSDEEYDSEMDDFIDDSEVDMGNISAEISRIFNYDRRKFTYADESDDECMESSVAEQLREEQRSLRIGIQEDLEDIKREEEEKKMKLLKMKKRR